VIRGISFFGKLLGLTLLAGVAAAQDGAVDYNYADLELAEPQESLPSPAPAKPRELTSGFALDPEEMGAPKDPPTERPSPTATAPAPTPTTAVEGPPSTQPGATPTPAKPLSRTIQNMQWEASLAENNYSISKSEAAKLALIGAYERILGPLCMPELHQTLRYSGPPTEPLCNEYLDKISALDNENVMVLCVRDGIDAKSCRGGFSKQIVETFIPNAGTLRSDNRTSPGAELEEKLAVSSVEPKVQAISDRIKSAEYQLRSMRTLSEEERLKLRKNFNEALFLSCRITRLEFRESGDKDAFPGQKPSSGRGVITSPTPPPLFPAIDDRTKKKNPFDEVLEQFGAQSVDPAPSVPLSSRIRVRKITDRCKNFVERALKFDQRMALPVCYREGFYTPSCIDAKRKEGLTAQKSPDGADSPRSTGSPGEGFSKF
jgi:hypothetical protein